MAETTLATLITAVTRTQTYAKLIDLATAMGLATESWQSGDPTRTTFDAVSRLEEIRDPLVINAIRGGFLGLAKGGWLTLVARYLYNVERRPAAFASCTVRLTNGANTQVDIADVGDVTVRDSDTEATFRNQTTGILPGGIGRTLDLTFIADEAGSLSTVGTGDIDELVSAVPNVSVTNITVGVGVDEESDDDLVERCMAKMQSISNGGPKGAYHFFAVTPEFNGGANVTRSRQYPDSDTGIVTSYLAGPSGAVSVGDVALVDAAYDTYAKPLCIRTVTASAVDKVQAITYTLFVYDTINLTNAQIEEKVGDALVGEIKKRRIGGDGLVGAGVIARSTIEAIILNAVAPYGYAISIATPSADITMDGDKVLVLGAITPTITQVAA